MGESRGGEGNDEGGGGGGGGGGNLIVISCDARVRIREEASIDENLDEHVVALRWMIREERKGGQVQLTLMYPFSSLRYMGCRQA